MSEGEGGCPQLPIVQLYCQLTAAVQRSAQHSRQIQVCQGTSLGRKHHITLAPQSQDAHQCSQRGALAGAMHTTELDAIAVRVEAPRYLRQEVQTRPRKHDG